MSEEKILKIFCDLICLIFALEIICVVMIFKLDGKYIDSMSKAFEGLYRYFRYNLTSGFNLSKE